jgi:hypothetical protein
MIYDKTRQIFNVFIINNKNTINKIYLVMFLWWRTNVSWKYSPPLMCPREVFAKIARDFKWFVFYFEPKSYTGGFFLPNGTNVVNFSIGTILQWSTLGYCNLNTYENEEVAFIGQRSGEPLKWRQFDKISKDTISKIKYTALSHNLMKPLKSSPAIYDYVKLQQLDDICQIRR